MCVPYYFNPKMHSLGNIGIGGMIHAEAALFATKTIDNIRYRGKNIRKDVYQEYINNNKNNVRFMLWNRYFYCSWELGY